MTTSDVYNSIAKEFSNSRHYKWPWITDFFENIVYKNNEHTDHKSKLILDVGCGNGRNISAYKNEKTEIYGIDNSREFITICRKKKLNCNEMDMCNIEYPDRHFDHIIMIASFHHLNTVDQRVKCLKELYRVLKPDGHILLSVWSIKQPKKTKRVFTEYGDTMVPWKSSKTGTIFERYYYIFKIEELIVLISQANFKIIDNFWNCGNEILIIQK